MGVYQVRLAGDAPNGRTWSVNPTFTIENGIGGEPTNAELLTKAGIVWTWWDAGQGGGPAGKTFVTNDRNLRRVRIGRLDVAVPPPAVVDERTPIAGTLADPALPPQCCTVISLRTNLSSRRTRGRVFWPGPNEALVTDGGFVDPTYAADLRDSFVDMVTAFEAPTVPVLNTDHVVFSRTGSSTEEVTTYLVGSVLDTQRRRRVRDVTYL